MKTITNEQKAKEIATTYYGKIISFAHLAALQMAQWKDEQHKQEKQQWIENAYEWWANNWRKYVMTDKDGIVALNHWKEDFIKAIKGE